MRTQTTTSQPRTTQPSFVADNNILTGAWLALLAVAAVFVAVRVTVVTVPTRWQAAVYRPMTKFIIVSRNRIGYLE